MNLILQLEELHSIFQSADEPITTDSLSKMTYIEMVIREAMRLFPAVPMIAREAAEDVQLKYGSIPKGTTMFFMIRAINRDRKYWGDDALEFNPERFHPENISNISPYSFMTLSRGPRNCIGAKYGLMSIKITVATILRRFKLKTDLKLKDIRFGWRLSAYFDHVNPVQFEPRHF